MKHKKIRSESRGETQTVADIWKMKTRNHTMVELKDAVTVAIPRSDLRITTIGE